MTPAPPVVRALRASKRSPESIPFGIGFAKDPPCGCAGLVVLVGEARRGRAYLSCTRCRATWEAEIHPARG